MICLYPWVSDQKSIERRWSNLRPSKRQGRGRKVDAGSGEKTVREGEFVGEVAKGFIIHLYTTLVRVRTMRKRSRRRQELNAKTATLARFPHANVRCRHISVASIENLMDRAQVLSELDPSTPAFSADLLPPPISWCIVLPCVCALVKRSVTSHDPGIRI